MNETTLPTVIRAAKAICALVISTQPRRTVYQGRVPRERPLTRRRGLHPRTPIRDRESNRSARAVEKLYGGLLTKNLMQPSARDLPADRVLSWEASEHRVAPTVHGEIVLQAPTVAWDSVGRSPSIPTVSSSATTRAGRQYRNAASNAPHMHYAGSDVGADPCISHCRARTVEPIPKLDICVFRILWHAQAHGRTARLAGGTDP